MNNHKEKFQKIVVFYGTDSKRSGVNANAKYYRNERNELNKYEVGTIEISIPNDHRIG